MGKNLDLERSNVFIVAYDRPDFLSATLFHLWGIEMLEINILTARNATPRVREFILKFGHLPRVKILGDFSNNIERNTLISSALGDADHFFWVEDDVLVSPKFFQEGRRNLQSGIGLIGSQSQITCFDAIDFLVEKGAVDARCALKESPERLDNYQRNNEHCFPGRLLGVSREVFDEVGIKEDHLLYDDVINLGFLTSLSSVKHLNIGILSENFYPGYWYRARLFKEDKLVLLRIYDCIKFFRINPKTCEFIIKCFRKSMALCYRFVVLIKKLFYRLLVVRLKVFLFVRKVEEFFRYHRSSISVVWLLKILGFKLYQRVKVDEMSSSQFKLLSASDSVDGQIINTFGVGPDTFNSEVISHPEVSCHRLSDTIIFPKSVSLLKRRQIYYPDASISDSYAYSNADGLSAVYNQKSVVFPVALDKSGSYEILQCGAHLCGSNSSGFGHIHYEYLPRLLLYKEVLEPDVPILVSSHVQLWTDLARMLKMDNPIVQVLKPTMVQDLWYVPKISAFPGDVNMWFRPNEGEFMPRASFSLAHYEMLRNKLSPLGRFWRKNIVPARRILVLRDDERNNSRRTCINLNELSSLCIDNGFEVIYPSQLSFREQIELIQDAHCVVGAQGSQMDTVLYGRGGLKVLFFCGSKINNFNYFVNSLLSLGIDGRIVYGVSEDRLDLQSPFRTEMSVAEKAIKWAIA